ncbi:MAG: HU family DNA-binding protein [Desulfovibrionaceae bacterium]|nr:HU family DNA-binding protein [Desulfovibrionaceae bacterium]
MNRSELCVQLAKECDLSVEDAVVIVNVFFDSISKALINGSRVEIRGLCSWQIKKYEGYCGRNPNTGDSITIPPKRLPFFKVGKELVDMLNEQLLPKMIAERG